MDRLGDATDGTNKTNLSRWRARALALAAYAPLKLGEESSSAHERQTARNRKMDLDGSSSKISDMISLGRLSPVHDAELLLFDALAMSSAMSEVEWLKCRRRIYSTAGRGW